MKPLKTLFFGTPDFCLPVMEVLVQHPLIELKSVVTMPDRPAGRGNKNKAPAVADFANQYKLPLKQTANINLEADTIKEWRQEEIDLVIVMAFAQFLGKELLELPSLGCFNIHTSLLPKYRGAAPIQYALLNGDTSTGVSIQKMVKRMDAGDIAISSTIPIYPYETGGLLYSRLKFLAANTLIDLIDTIAGNNVKFTSQDENLVSFAPTIQKQEGHLDFARLTAIELYNRIRAFDPRPGTFCFINDQRIKILQAELTDSKTEAGTISTESGFLVIGTSSGALRVTRLQKEGKKACSDLDFLRGMGNQILKLTPKT